MIRNNVLSIYLQFPEEEHDYYTFWCGAEQIN